MLAIAPLHEKSARRIPMWVWVVLGLLVTGLAGWGVSGLLGGGKAKKSKPPVKAFLMPDKPPPPPPKEEKKPEPPKNENKEVKLNTPQTPAPIAQNEPLKMEGATGDGPSAFGGGSVSREGVLGGLGSTTYGVLLQKHLQTELNRNRKLKESDYRVVVRVWVGKDGEIQKAELEKSTGIDALDDLLKQTLLQLAAMKTPPPDNTHQPMRIRVTARGAT